VDQDLRSIQQARDLALRAKAAADQWATATQVEVDRAVEAMAVAGRRAAPRLAELAVQVTGYGRADHKLIKDLFAVVDVYDTIAPIRTVGALSVSREAGVVEIAEPAGVIAALVPTTNPVSTVLFKALIAVKSRNAVVMAPHPRAVAASAAATEVLAEALRSAGAPDGLLTCMTDVSLEGTRALWSHYAVSLLLATGSMAMVRDAYSSGKPTYAVGPGNVPAYIHESVVDLDSCVAGTLASTTFDNGTPCASEQAVVVDRSIERRARERLESLGGRFLTEDEAERLARVVVTPAGTLHPEAVGQSAQGLAERAGIGVEPETTVLVVSPRGVGREHPLSMEILTSMLKWYVVSGPEQGIAQASELVRFGGDGHTAAVWSGDVRVTAAYAARIRVFRVLVNTPTCFGAMGATAALPPSVMLGTGTWGGGITADNIGPLHLINRKRVAEGVRDWRELLETAPGQAPAHASPLVTGVAEAVRDPKAVAADLVQRVLQRLDESTGVAG
jgi:acetaldehyde dehydrogenase (acetylating)